MRLRTVRWLVQAILLVILTELGLSTETQTKTFPALSDRPLGGRREREQQQQFLTLLTARTQMVIMGRSLCFSADPPSVPGEDAVS